MNFKHIGKENSKKEEITASSESSLTRRNFLRNSSTASVGAGLIVTSKTALGQEGPDKGEKVRCGIIGY